LETIPDRSVEAMTNEAKSALHILCEQVRIIRATFGAAAADDNAMLTTLIGMAVPELRDQIPAFIELRAALALAQADAPERETKSVTTSVEPSRPHVPNRKTSR